MLDREELAKLQRRVDDTEAPAGTVWVCGACGKTSRTRYGLEADRSAGWDAACVVAAILVNTEAIADPTDWQPYQRVKSVR